MLSISGFVCNCLELVGYYNSNNWSGNFKMSDELVPKHYQYTNPHLDTQRQTKRLELLRKEGGWEVETGDWVWARQSSTKNRPVMAIWCDWTVCPLASWHQPAPLWPNLPAPSCQGQMQTKKNRGKHTQTHIQTDFVFMTTPWKTQKVQDKLLDRAKEQQTTAFWSCLSLLAHFCGWISYYIVTFEFENKVQ